MSASMPEEYHLEFVDNDVSSPEPFLTRLESYIDTIYAKGGGPCPVTYSKTKPTANDGRTHVLVRFELKATAVEKYFEVNLAGPEFCERMFAEPCRKALDNFKTTILGVTPVNADWKACFTTAYLSQAMVEGVKFAADLGRTLQSVTIPLHGTLALGFAFRAFLKLEFQGAAQTLKDWATEKAREHLGGILGVYESKRSHDPPPKIQSEWERQAGQLDLRAMVYIQALRVYAAHVAQPSDIVRTVEEADDDSELDAANVVVMKHNVAEASRPSSATTPHALTKAYYNLVEVLISFATSSKALLTTLTKTREHSNTGQEMGVACLGMSVAAGYESMTTFAAGQVVLAEKFTEGTLVALGVTGSTGVIEFLVPETLCTNPMLMCCALIGATASVGYLAASNMSRSDSDSFEGLCKQLHRFLDAAYTEAWLSNTIVTLTHCPNGVNLDYADSFTRQRWKQLAKQMHLQQIFDVSKTNVEAQLCDRADALQQYRHDMTTAVAKLARSLTADAPTDGQEARS